MVDLGWYYALTERDDFIIIPSSIVDIIIAKIQENKESTGNDLAVATGLDPEAIVLIMKHMHEFNEVNKTDTDSQQATAGKASIGHTEFSSYAKADFSAMCAYLADYQPQIAFSHYKETDYRLLTIMYRLRVEHRGHEVSTLLECVTAPYASKKDSNEPQIPMGEASTQLPKSMKF